MATTERRLEIPSPSTTFRGYKWLAEGAVDPDHAAWTWSEAEAEAEARRGRPDTLFAMSIEGLPYRVDDELWEVELADVLGASPFPEQTSYASPEFLKERELRVLASQGRLIRRIEAWTADVAQEFAANCARAARERALAALHDADRALSPRDSGSTDALARLMFNADPQAVERELMLLEQVESQVAIWRDALSADAFGISHPADAYAAAAASARAAAASVYVMVDPQTADDVLAPERAYLEERRRQAAWLRDWLDLDSSGVAMGLGRHSGRRVTAAR